MGQTPGSIVPCGHVMPFSHRKMMFSTRRTAKNCQEESVEIESSSDSEDPVLGFFVISGELPGSHLMMERSPSGQIWSPYCGHADDLH